MPNREVIRQWAEALPNYKQGRHMLRCQVSENGVVGEGGDYHYCCWGVLCEISPFDHWDATDAYPPASVLNWAGLGDLFTFNSRGETAAEGGVEIPESLRERINSLKDPHRFGSPDFETRLAELNDIGLPFEQIAEVIRHNWLGDDEDER